MRNKAEHAVQSYAAGVNYLSKEGFENVGTYWPHAKYMLSIFHEHAENILWRCWVYAMNILNICNKDIEYAMNILRICWAHAKNMLTTC